MSEEKRPFTIDDLGSIIIADSITAKDATDEQFYTWADKITAFEISERPEQPWPLHERVNLCSMLYKMGVIRL